MSEPIIVLGAPRSGTTLLSEVLSAHPDVAFAREPRLVWRYGNDRRSDELRPVHATAEVVDHIHASFATFVAATAAGRLLEKTPANAVRPRFVDAVFPDARFVHITRDGWAAVPSLRSFWERRGTGVDARQVRKIGRRLREAHPSQVRFYSAELLRRLSPGRSRRIPLYGPRLAGLQQVVDELGHLEAAAHQWRTCVEQTVAFGRSLSQARYLEVRLEDLDRGSLDPVLEFCGLPPSAEVEARFDETHDAEAARRLTPLSDAESQAVAPYIAPLNALLGYPTEPVSHRPETKATSR